MLVTAFIQVLIRRSLWSRNEVGSFILTNRLTRFQLETFEIIWHNISCKSMCSGFQYDLI